MQLHWIWFAGLQKIPAAQKLALLQRFPDPEEIFEKGAAALFEMDDVAREMEQELQMRDTAAAQKILRSCANKGIEILTFAEEAYPARLRNISNPPFVLYYRGILPAWNRMPAVGAVGTRKATAYGMSVARQMAQQLSACGAVVVSGGAAGIDTMALRGALEAGGPAVAVLGCGVDVIYPKSNKRLFDQILHRGCLISEYAPGTPPNRWNFPARNRIISGMSNGILVVEAPEKSGALITANTALEQGRDVFVVPGNIDVAACAGSNALLQGYAMAAFTGWDILQEYRHLYPDKVEKRDVPAHIREAEFAVAKVAQNPVLPEQPAGKAGKQPPLSEEEALVAACLSVQPKQVDEIIARVNLPAAKVTGILTMLSIKGVACNHPGNRVSLKQ